MKNRASQYQSFVDIDRILDLIFKLTVFFCILLGILWSRDGVGIGGKIFFGTAILSILLWLLNRWGYPQFSGTVLFIALTIIITYFAIKEDGFYNVPIIAYPIIIIFSGILFGRRVVPYTTGLTLLAVTAFWYLERRGVIQPFNDAINYWVGDFITAIILLCAAGTTLWLLLTIVENNIEKIIRSEEQLKRTYDLTLKGWAQALELKGREPQGHHQRVLDLVSTFGETLALDEAEKEKLFYGALLHDIGKMGIPDSILLKDGPLSEEEYEFVKKHTQWGSEMLEKIPALKTALEIVLSHHEQWDGRGYPNGLESEAIPLTARVYAIVDNWDALTHDQVYRSAWDKQKTAQYLIEQSGLKFEPELVQKFLEIAAER